MTSESPELTGGTFGGQNVIESSANGAWSVSAADIDGDGDMDVLGASFDDDEIAWYRNDGNENFTKRASGTDADGAVNVLAADLDGDGDMDVLSASRNDDKLAWYQNDGSENFTELPISTASDGVQGLFVADMDGDGDLDVLSASRVDDKVAWYENDGSQSFAEHVVTTNANRAQAVAAADLDSDGDMDILSASVLDDKIAWYRNDGLFNFTENAITTTLNGPYSVEVADLDGDGDMDVIATSSLNNLVVWYRNDGNGTFTEQLIGSDADAVRSTYTADMDGDGDLDVVAAFRIGDDVVWYENDSLTFTEHVITTATDGPQSVFVADIDSDGDLDVLSASDNDDMIAWYEHGSANATNCWGTAVSGNWTDARKWDTGTVPAPGDNVCIDAVGADYTVTLNTNVTTANALGSFTLDSANATFATTDRTFAVDGASNIIQGTVHSDGTTWTGGAGSSLTSDGDIVVFGGTTRISTASFQQNGNVNIQADANSAATLRSDNGLTNMGTILLENVAGCCPVPRDAQLTVVGGDLVNTASGVITASPGLGNRIVSADVINDGTVNINHPTTLSRSNATFVNNNTVNVTSALDFGSNGVFTQAAGSLTVSGLGSIVLADDTFHFDGGSISGNAISLSASALHIGPGSTGTGAFYFTGSSNTISGDIAAGQHVTVAATAFVDSTLTNVGGFTNHGTIVLTNNAGCCPVARDTYLTVTAGGTLINATDGVITAEPNLGERFISAHLTNNGTINVNTTTSLTKSSGVYDNSGTLHIAPLIRLSVEGNSFTNTDSGEIVGGGNLDLRSLSFFGDGTATANVNVISSTFDPGDMPADAGVFQVAGLYAQSTNFDFNIEFGGPIPGSGSGFHDQLDVNGSVTLDGTNLNLSTIGGYVPTGGEQFVIVNKRSSGAVTGTFSGLPEGATISNFLGSGLDAVISYTGGTGNDVVITVEPVGIFARHIFYNRSGFDGTSDDNAIATDKEALLPGGTAAFENYISDPDGITGIMLDIGALSGAPQLSDFTFLMGNDNSPTSWLNAPAPTLTIRAGEGGLGSDRVVFTWPDDSIVGQWLQVTVNENAAINLPGDVFYVGSAPGETGDSTFNALVNGFDFAGVRDNVTNPAGIENRMDFNRDRSVDGADLAVTRDQVTDFDTALRLITPVTPPPAQLALIGAERREAEQAERVRQSITRVEPLSPMVSAQSENPEPLRKRFYNQAGRGRLGSVSHPINGAVDKPNPIVDAFEPISDDLLQLLAETAPV